METKKSILIVEDEPAIRFGLKYGLSENGYEFLTAEDISQACLIIDAKKPDLIILDVMLPGGRDEGFKLCERLKTNEASKDIPIIILTARPARDETIAMSAGADRYFTKPPNMLEFKEAIQELFGEA
jgi:two-component system phosphate regulon response regulator PhoB